MAKPTKRFSASLGGNSAGADIARFEAGGGAVVADIVADVAKQEEASTPAPKTVKGSTAKEKTTKRGSRAAAAEKVEEAASPSYTGALLLAPVRALPPVRYDFRKLPEPQKTLLRVEHVLTDPRLTHGERAAAALLALAFSDGPDTRELSLRQLLSDARGFSSKVRNTFISSMTELGLMEYEYIRGKGSRITLLF